MSDFMIATIIILFWAICSFVSYGLTLGYFQCKFALIARKYRRKDVRDSLIISAAGPVSLLVAMSFSFTTRWSDYGLYSPPFLTRPLTEDQASAISRHKYGRDALP